MLIAKLEIDGNSEQGYRLSLAAIGAEHFESKKANLPELPPQLNLSFQSWRGDYCDLEPVRRMSRLQPKEIVIKPQSDQPVVTRYSSIQARNQVKQSLNEWLNSGSDSRWQRLREELILLLSRSQGPDEEIRLLLDDENLHLCLYPWQEWELLESRFPQTEIALRIRGKGSDPIKPIIKAPKARILLVEGGNGGLNTHLDVEVVRNLEAKGAEVKYLAQPTREQLSEALRDERGYHIFVFSGHSRSDTDSDTEGKIGWIGLRDDDELSIDEFKRNFRVAINRGLQLALFNSCDGLGLAHQLAELNLPRCIVMQEPIPDEVAVKFIKSFFDEFIRNKSLFAAMHQARTALESFDNPKQYPGVMWLPRLCIRESALSDPLLWEKLIEPKLLSQPTDPKATKSKFQSLSQFLPKYLPILVGILVAGLGWQIYQTLQDQTNSVASNPENCPTQAVPATAKGAKSDECFAGIDVPSGNVLHGGSTTWAPIRERVNPQIEQVHPNYRLTYQQSSNQAPGSGSGIEMLIKNQISFAESSRSLLPEEIQAAANQGFLLKSVPVAIDAIAIVVHPNLDIKGLTIEQLQKIYTGAITNWNQVGGPDLKITPYSRPIESGTTEFFKENILGNAKFDPGVKTISTTTTAISQLSQNLGGIYYATASEVVSQCQIKPLAIQANSTSPLVAPYQEPLVPPGECPQKRNQLNGEAFLEGQYPITRRIFVVIKQDNSVDQRVGEAYADLLLTNQGQQLIQGAGFIPIRSTP